MNADVLDRPVWNALSTRQAAFALGGGRARRFAPDIGPLAGACDDAPESLAELVSLVTAHDTLLLLQADPIALPPQLYAVKMVAGVQMVASELAREARAVSDRDVVQLGAPDVPAMVALATLTKPGPFATRTSSLGTFWGIMDGGTLVAMAGERMRHDGFTEVSGVCSHPDVRGCGLAKVLSAVVAARILDRGERPYLHAYASNTAALRLYESLGFRLRRAVHVASVALAPCERES